MKSIVFVLFIFCASIFTFTDATMCKPLSQFKIDCNTCTCSNSGREYTCSKYICPLNSQRGKFTEEDGEDGYILLKPKESNEKYLLDDDDSFILTKQERRPRLTHINNEIEGLNNIYNDLNINYAIPDLEEANKDDDDDENNYVDVNDVNEDSENWDEFFPRIKRTLKI